MGFLIPDRIDVYHHTVLDSGTIAKIDLLIERTGIIMADTQATLAALAAANASLDGIQSDITALKALIDAGATPQEVADAVNALAARAAGIDSQTP